MGIVEVLKSLMSEYKKINIKKLPSQGLFYRDDIDIKIKKADVEDIIEYEYKFEKNNIISTIECIKRVVNKNAILSSGYSYMDIKSVDIIFIFLEIVKFTTNREIKIPYTNMIGVQEFVSFDINHFNYFDFSEYLQYHDTKTKEIVIDGYRFSPPSIGVETSLTEYLANVVNEKDAKMLHKASYDFMFFLGGKSSLTFPEIGNLVSIFNYDIDDIEISKIRNIVEKFKNLVSYSLIIDGSPIEVRTKIDLSTIWKI